MNTRRFLVIFSLAVSIVISTAQVSFSAPWDLEQLTVRPGFGDAWNRYAYAHIYYEGDPDVDGDDALYVGTWNTRTRPSALAPYYSDPLYGIGPYTSSFLYQISKGGEIWKYHMLTETWSLVWPTLDLSNFDPNDVGWRVAQLYEDKIYIGSYNTQNGTRLMVLDPAVEDAEDAVNFIEPTTDPAAWAQNDSTRGMAVYNGKLYIGTEANTAQLWSYDGTRLEPVPLTFNVRSIAELKVYGEYLYIGTWYAPGVYRMDAAGVITDITPAGISGETGGIMSMEEFQGKLFAGTADFGNGFSLFYYISVDDSDPTFVTQTGFGGNTYAWSLRECGNLLFMGAMIDFFSIGGGLWATSDGLTEEDWTNLTDLYTPVSSEYGLRNLDCGVNGDGTKYLFYGTAESFWVTSSYRFTGGTRIFRVEGPFDALP